MRGVALNVGREGIPVLQHIDQLGADPGGCCFDRIEPGEVVPVVELDLRESRKEVVARFLKIDIPPAEKDVERVQKSGRRLVLDQANGGQMVAQRCLRPHQELIAYRLGAGKFLAQFRCQSVIGRFTGLQGGAIERHGRPGVPGLTQHVRLDDQRADIFRLMGKRPIDRSKGSRQVAEAAAGHGKPQTGKGVVDSGSDDACERFPGLVRVAALQRFHTGLCQGARVDGGSVHGFGIILRVRRRPQYGTECCNSSNQRRAAQQSVVQIGIKGVLARTCRLKFVSPDKAQRVGEK